MRSYITGGLLRIVVLLRIVLLRIVLLRMVLLRIVLLGNLFKTLFRGYSRVIWRQCGTWDCHLKAYFGA